jgi:hypothetical protein
MQFQDRLLLQLFTSLLTNIPQKENDIGRVLRFALFGFLFCLILLLLVGNETIKIIHRSKIGRNEISFLRVFLSASAFGIIGTILLNKSSYFSHMDFPTFGGKEVSLKEVFVQATGVFYIIMATFVLIKGIYLLTTANKMSIPPLFPGNSIIFGVLEKRFSKEIIRNFFEPLSFLVLGGIFIRLNPFFGFPISICSLSYWLMLMSDFTFNIEFERNKAIQQFFNKDKIDKNTSVIQ